MPAISKSRLVAVLSAIALALFFILPVSSVHAAATSMFSASPSRIFLGESVTITWNSAVDFTCVGTNFNTNGALSGTVTVQPTSTGVKTYAIDCSSPGARFAEKDIVTVNSAPPPSGLSASISASPTTVTEGDSSLVSWSSSGATTCRGTNFSTGGATKGSVSTTPTKNTTYSITCDGQTTVSSTSGTWQYSGSDITDLWCTQTPGKYSNFYTENQCPGNSDPTGQSCTGSETCAVNNWQTKGNTGADPKKLYCNLKSDLYRCNGGSGSTPNQVTDSVTVVVNHAPNAPVITGPTFGAPDTDYSFSFRADDPDGDKIRYRIDWDNNGSAEKVLPSPGHVNSNTLLDALRSWAGIGTYTFRAKTQDSHGALSGWASHTIRISSGDTPPGPDGPPPGGGPGGPGGGGPPGGPGSGEPLLRTSECKDGIDNNGVYGADYPDDPACESPDDTEEGALPSADVSLSVNRWLVLSGSSVVLAWSAVDVEPGSCTLSGTNKQSWPLSGESEEGTQQSSSLTSETRFTLLCNDYNGEEVSDSVLVRLVPRYREQ